MERWITGIGASLCLISFGACDGIWAKDAFTALRIIQVQVNSDAETSRCTIPGEPTELHRTSGTLDVGLPDGYRPFHLPVSVGNGLAKLGQSEAEEVNNIRLQSFHIELSGYNTETNADIIWDADKCPKEFDDPTGTVTISPGGYSGASVTAILASHAWCLRSQVPALVTAKIIAKGRHGGTTIQSAPFEFIIEVCSGCLQMGYADPQIASLGGQIPECAALTSNPYPGGCYPGQDDTILCCAIRAVPPATNHTYYCPAIPMGAPPPTSTP